MKVGDLVRDLTQPTLGVGIIITLHRMDPGYQGRYSGVLAIFGDCENRFVGRDNVEVIDNA